MHAGLCLLRLPPDLFWALSPIEFFAMAGGFGSDASALPGPDRAALDRLMRAFPDR